MLEIHFTGDGRVKLSGRLDATQADRADRELQGVQGSVTLDCAELDYISSAGLGVLIELYKRLHAAGHTLTLVNLLPRVRNIFAYAGLDRILKIE